MQSTQPYPCGSRSMAEVVQLFSDNWFTDESHLMVFFFGQDLESVKSRDRQKLFIVILASTNPYWSKRVFLLS